jgi:hypothetical protein
MAKSEARSEAMRRRWQRDREKMDAQRQRAVNTPGRLDPQKLSENAKKQWQDPSFRLAVTSAVSESNRRRWVENRDKELENAREAQKHIDFQTRGRAIAESWKIPSAANLKHLQDMQQSLVRKAAVSSALSKKWADGWRGSRGHSKGLRYKGVWMRSSWEVTTARWLDSMGVEWFYEPKRFELPDGKGYIPDFYIPAWNRYYEVKPSWAWDSNYRKCQDKAGVVRSQGHRLTVLTETHISAFLSVLP